MKRLAIVAAVILDDSKQNIYITKRQAHQDQAGFWEFPGGKIEAGETNLQALTRELQEEIAINIVDTEPLCQFDYDYPEQALHLSFYLVNKFTGKPQAMEGQQGQWIAGQQLQCADFPPANRPLIHQIKQKLFQTIDND